MRTQRRPGVRGRAGGSRIRGTDQHLYSKKDGFFARRVDFLQAHYLVIVERQMDGCTTLPWENSRLLHEVLKSLHRGRGVLEEGRRRRRTAEAVFPPNGMCVSSQQRNATNAVLFSIFICLRAFLYRG